MRIPINPPQTITQPFGVPEKGSAFGLHSGIDYGCPTGTPVYACISGTVSTVTNDQYHGNVVDIENGGKWYRVMHLQRFVVTSGHVNEGDLIAYSNNTGFSTGPHLHWDVRTQYTPTSFAAFINPLTLLKEAEVPITEDNMYSLIRGILGREPTLAEMQNQDYRDDANLAIATFWNNGGKTRYESPPANGSTNFVPVTEQLYTKKA